jgi:hypothetical protein
MVPAIFSGERVFLYGARGLAGPALQNARVGRAAPGSILLIYCDNLVEPATNRER